MCNSNIHSILFWLFSKCPTMCGNCSNRTCLSSSIYQGPLSKKFIKLNLLSTCNNIHKLLHRATPQSVKNLENYEAISVLERLFALDRRESLQRPDFEGMTSSVSLTSLGLEWTLQLFDMPGQFLCLSGLLREGNLFSVGWDSNWLSGFAKIWQLMTPENIDISLIGQVSYGNLWHI